MYKKTKSLHLVSSVSPFAKNLSTIYDDQYIHVCSAHKISFNIITLNNENRDNPESKQVCVQTDKEATVDKDYIIQIKWLKLNEKILLVVHLHNGLKIYDSIGKNLFYSYSYSVKNDNNPENMYSSGIAAINGSIACIGGNNGSILMFSMNETNKISFIENSAEVMHKRPITDLVSDDNKTLVSCDDSGKIMVWHYVESRFKLNNCFEGYNGFSCNCLGLLKQYLLAGYGSGHLRVFDIEKQVLLCEISAHAKWITAIDISPESGQILSTSEDSFVRVWKLDEQDQSLKIIQEFGQNISNHMLFGGVFLNKSGNSFCVAGYDSLELHYFVK